MQEQSGSHGNTAVIAAKKANKNSEGAKSSDREDVKLTGSS